MRYIAAAAWEPGRREVALGREAEGGAAEEVGVVYDGRAAVRCAVCCAAVEPDQMRCSPDWSGRWSSDETVPRPQGLRMGGQFRACLRSAH